MVKRSSRRWPWTSALGLYDSQIFGGKIVGIAALETDAKDTAIFPQPQFARPLIQIVAHRLDLHPALPRSLRILLPRFSVAGEFDQDEAADACLSNRLEW